MKNIKVLLKKMSIDGLVTIPAALFVLNALENVCADIRIGARDITEIDIEEIIAAVKRKKEKGEKEDFAFLPAEREAQAIRIMVVALLRSGLSGDDYDDVFLMINAIFDRLEFGDKLH